MEKILSILAMAGVIIGICAAGCPNKLTECSEAGSEEECTNPNSFENAVFPGEGCVYQMRSGDYDYEGSKGSCVSFKSELTDCEQYDDQKTCEEASTDFKHTKCEWKEDKSGGTTCRGVFTGKLAE